MKIENGYAISKLKEEGFTIKEAKKLAQKYFDVLLEENPMGISVKKEDLAELKLDFTEEAEKLFIHLPEAINDESTYGNLINYFTPEVNAAHDKSELYNMDLFRQDTWRPGSASGKDADQNMPKMEVNDMMVPNYKWNHDEIKMPQALNIARNPKHTRAQKLEENTGLNVFQLDTGYSMHDSLFGTSPYIDYTRDPNKSTGFKPNDGTSNPAIDSLREYNIGARNRQKPGHGTATGFMVVGKEGLPPENWPQIQDLQIVPDFPVFFTKNLSGGLFPYVNFYPVKAARYVGFSDGYRRFLTSTILNIKTDHPKSLIEGLKHAGENDADVITMSIGGSIYKNEKALKQQIKNNYEKGIIQVCAAGNSKRLDKIEDEIKPADYVQTICCAAIEPRMTDGNIIMIPWTKSCDGKFVDISAPGRYIYTAAKLDPNRIPEEFRDRFGDGNVYKWGGATSQATAHTAAVAALWRNYYNEVLQDSYYQSEKWRIVEAFRFALYSSKIIPDHWASSKRTLKKYNGILNAEGILSNAYAPDTAECKKFIDKVADKPKRNRRKIFNKL